MVLPSGIHSSAGKRNRKIVMGGQCSIRVSTSFLESTEENDGLCLSREVGDHDHILR